MFNGKRIKNFFDIEKSENKIIHSRNRNNNSKKNLSK